MLSQAWRGNVTYTYWYFVIFYSDHADGNGKMAELVKGISVYGGDTRIPALTKKVVHGDTFQVQAW